jgi:hypothetical protein
MPESDAIVVGQRHIHFQFFSLFYYLSVIFDESTNKYSFSIKVLDSDDEEVIFWPNLNLQHFEVLHMMTRIFLLLPDKIATAIEIEAENIPGDSGSFLIELVVKLIEDALIKARHCNLPNAFVSNISNLYEDLRDISQSFDERNISFDQIKQFLIECQLSYNLSKIYADCCHSQLIYLSRFGCFSPQLSESLQNVLDTIIEKNLLWEYQLLTANFENDE